MYMNGMLSEEDFQERVLSGVKSLESKSERMKGDFDGLNKVTQKALEDVARIKECCNDLYRAQKRIERAQFLVDAGTQRGRLSGIDRIAADPVMSAYVEGHFRRAIGLQLTPEQKTAITGVDGGIGTAVTPMEVNNAIYDALLAYGQWNTLGQVPVGTRTESVPLVTARPTAYWVAQGTQIAEGAMTGTAVTLTIKEAAAWIPIANALLEDETSNFGSYALTALAQAVAYRLDWACFAADGTNDTTDGAYTGIAVGGTAAEAAAGNTSVAALEVDDFVKCLTTVDAAVLTRAAKWWIHPQILAKICLIKDLNGRSIFQNALEAPSPGAIGSILGYPVVVTGAMPSTDSTEKVLAVFGDPEGAAVAIRKEFNLAKSTDFQFDYNRTAFRMIVRAGFVIKNATSFAMLTTPGA